MRAKYLDSRQKHWRSSHHGKPEKPKFQEWHDSLSYQSDQVDENNGHCTASHLLFTVPVTKMQETCQSKTRAEE